MCRKSLGHFLFFRSIRFPYVHDKASEKPIPYSENITAFAEQMASDLSPFWAVHWRTERVDPAENLVNCATSLVNLMHDRAQDLGLNRPPTFFLLTDYPHVFDAEDVQLAINDTDHDAIPHPASASFSADSLTRWHHEAMQFVYDHLPVQVSSLAYDQKKIAQNDAADDEGLEQMVRLPANWTVLPVPTEIASNDNGVLGIVDKLLAIRADLFIAGKPGVCARKSSFTTRIVDERINRRLDELKTTSIPEFDTAVVEETWADTDDTQDGTMKNIIEYFDLPSVDGGDREHLNE